MCNVWRLKLRRTRPLKLRGNRMVMTLTGTQLVVAAQLGVGVGLLLPAVQSSRIAAQRMQSLINLKQIASRHFELRVGVQEAAGRQRHWIRCAFPKAKWNPISVGRVHILPYLEQVSALQRVPPG